LVKVKGKAVPVLLTELHAVKKYWGSGGIAQHILDFGTRWRRVVSFTTRPLFSKGKSPWYPLDRRLGGLIIKNVRFSVTVCSTKLRRAT
jgi:hypothetical protein